ncbi:MAG: hydroxymethylbilane synthase [Alphaproteobacteria bacterium]|nr:hydroxymethylbilane synthase [Alphaproteobacteria bacterium]
MTTAPHLRIGTRGSPLALAQAHEVRNRLIAAHPDLAAPGAIAIEVIRTTGDAMTDRPLAEIGGKGLFTKEIEEALIERRIDLAVHSMKDVPTALPAGLVIDCVLPREDPRDALIATGVKSLADLPRGARIGTASLRRQAQLLRARPDFTMVMLRGNVETRVRKVRDGMADATLLALAGLKRLDALHHVAAVLEPEAMLPAVAQGAIGIERRLDDRRVAALLAPINHKKSLIRITAERALLAALEGDCRTPIAALAEIDGNQLRLRALLATPDGRACHRAERRAPLADAARLGHELGEALKAEAGPGFFAWRS